MSQNFGTMGMDELELYYEEHSEDYSSFEEFLENKGLI